MIALGIDAGGTATRWLLRDGERELGGGQVDSLTGHLFSEESRRQAAAQIQQLCRDVLDRGRPAAALAGVTGLEAEGNEGNLLRQLIAAGLELPEAAVQAHNDMHVAYHSAFAPGAGVLLYAGTGTVAYHQPQAGRPLRAGGLGYIIDDAGGGYYLGQRALQQVMRQADRLGAPPTTTLAEHLYHSIGGRDWATIRAFVYGGGRPAVASLAPAIVAACRAGDDDACALLEDAGRELARLARVLLTRLERRLPIGFAGGISRVGGPLEAALRAALPPRTEFMVVTEEPVVAAARLAQALVPPQS